jgi:hypothetical protein
MILIYDLDQFLELKAHPYFTPYLLNTPSKSRILHQIRSSNDILENLRMANFSPLRFEPVKFAGFPAGSSAADRPETIDYSIKSLSLLGLVAAFAWRDVRGSLVKIPGRKQNFGLFAGMAETGRRWAPAPGVVWCLSPGRASFVLIGFVLITCIALRQTIQKA